MRMNSKQAMHPHLHQVSKSVPLSSEKQTVTMTHFWYLFFTFSSNSTSFPTNFARIPSTSSSLFSGTCSLYTRLIASKTAGSQGWFSLPLCLAMATLDELLLTPLFFG